MAKLEFINMLDDDKARIDCGDYVIVDSEIYRFINIGYNHITKEELKPSFMLIDVETGDRLYDAIFSDIVTIKDFKDWVCKTENKFTAYEPLRPEHITIIRNRNIKITLEAI